MDAMHSARWIRPQGSIVRSGSDTTEAPQPWVGVIIDPDPYRLTPELYLPEHAGYVYVQCVDACGTRGMRVGDIYAVRSEFVQDSADHH